LRDAISDEDVKVVREAILRLVRADPHCMVGDTSAALTESSLLALSQEHGWYEAVLAVGVLGTPGAIPVLEDIGTSSADSAKDWYLLQARARLGDSRARREVLADLDSDNLHLRARAVQAVLYLRDRCAIPKLLPLLNEHNPRAAGRDYVIESPASQAHTILLGLLRRLEITAPFPTNAPRFFRPGDEVLWQSWWDQQPEHITEGCP
jgi:hypothetical protein